MKFRTIVLFSLFALAAVILSACSLAADITPPPNYVAPTAAPTLGPLFPASPADIQNGAVIFASKCAPCHGATGLGDGAQGKSLPVAVAALGLPQTAQKASPAAWFTVVTQGNIDRFMPPFASLTDQERWDVISYALSLHATPDMLAKGKSLFETNCANCSTDFFTNQEKMASLSENDLVSLIQKGNDSVTAFGASLSQDDLSSVAAYLRSLTFAAPAPATATAVPATQASAAADGSTTTPAAEGTAQATPADAYPNPTSGTPQADTTATYKAVGPVSGSIVLNNGASLPSDIKVTLRGFDHTADSNGPKETLTLDGVPAANGTVIFDNVDLIEGRIFLIETTYNGILYQSALTVVKAGDTQIVLAPINLYDTSTDFSQLVVDQGHVFLDVGDTTVQVVEFMNIRNPTKTSILVPVADNQMAIAKMPTGMTSLGYDAQQGDAMPVQAADGFAFPPSDKLYGVVAGFEFPYDKSASIELPFVLGMPAGGSVFVPKGVTLEGAGLIDKGEQDIGSGTIYHVYEFGEIKPGDSLSVKLSGRPSTTGGTTSTGGISSQQTLIIGAGVLGLVLIGLGIWLYLRDRKRGPQGGEAETEEENEFEDSESVLDAIIALDDLHRAGKLPDEAYQKRRAELKEQLKRLETRE